MLVNAKNEIQYYLRRNLFGKLQFRSGLPKVKPKENEAKYYSLIFKKALALKDPSLNPSHLIDVGCRNWSYNRVLAQFFPNASLLGVEADGFRRYLNLYRRMDAAKAHAQDLENFGRQARFLPKDFASLEPQDIFPAPVRSLLFCFLFPFVSDRPCLKWGLPTRFNSFSEQLIQAKSLASFFQTPLQFISAHQGKWEMEAAKDIFEALGIAIKETHLPQSEFSRFWPSPSDTHITVNDG